MSNHESFAGRQYVKEEGNLAPVSDKAARELVARVARAKDPHRKQQILEQHLHRVGWTSQQIRADRAKSRMN